MEVSAARGRGGRPDIMRLLMEKKERLASIFLLCRSSFVGQLPAAFAVCGTSQAAGQGLNQNENL